MTLGLLVLASACKGKGASPEPGSKTPSKVPGVKASKADRTSKRKPRRPKNPKSLLYVRVRFADLFSIPQIQGKTEELKVAALKQGYLGALLRCRLDFTSQLEVLALQVPQDFKTSRRGALTLKGQFEPATLARCVFKDLSFTVSGTDGGILTAKGDNLTLEVDTGKKGILQVRTVGWTFVPWDRVPDPYHQFAKKTADLPALILGSLDPVIPWPDPPRAILLGVTPLFTGLRLRAILNFGSETGAKTFEAMAKKKLVEIVKGAPAGAGAVHITLLKKTGIKRIGARVLASVTAGWGEVMALVKLVQVKVRVKQ